MPMKPGESGKKKGPKLPIERDGIIVGNPEKFYTFGDEIGMGKFSVARFCEHKIHGGKYAAKIIRYDADTIKFAIREYDFMMTLDMNNKGLVKLHEAYLVRKYLILILDAADGLTLLDHCCKQHIITEDKVAGYIKELLEVLKHMHEHMAVHLDIRPTNIRFNSANEMKLLDYNACKFVANRKAGAVVDVIGDTEFCAPEMLQFEPVLPESDIWSVAVLAYIMLSGISPFFYEDEDMVVKCVQTVKWSFDADAFENITSEAKDFIEKCLVRAPESRMTATQALEHKWLSDDYSEIRKNSILDIKKQLQATDERLYSEEEEEYMWASWQLRTFEEDEYVTPESEEEE